MKKAQIIKYLIVATFVVFSSVVYGRDNQQLSNLFKEILKPSVKYSDYIRKRNHLLALEGAEVFLKEKKQDVKSGVLAHALLSRVQNKAQCDKVRVKLADSLDPFIRPVKRNVKYAPHVRPDPTRKPMFPSFKCRENVKEYLLKEEEHWKKHGSPFEGWHTMDIKGPTREEYIEAERRRLWDINTPCLGPAMCEIAVKGWHNKENVEKLKEKGYGEDYYRYMAVHLLGELKYKKTADYLLEILKDSKQDEYLRAHAARALIKIDAFGYVEDFYQLTYVDQASSTVINREITWDRFPPPKVVRTVKKLLPQVDSFKKKRLLILRLKNVFRDDAELQQEVMSILKDLRQDPDVRIRLTVKNIMQSLSVLPYTPENYKTKEERLKYMDTLNRMRAHSKSLIFDNVFFSDRNMKLFNLRRGETNKEDSEELKSFYLGIIDHIAKGYTEANVFSTKELHNYEWPENVKDDDARSFFQNVRKLKKGMSEAEVKKIVGSTVKEFIRRTIPGTGVLYVEYKKIFDSEVECNFGLKVDHISFEIVFNDDKLRIVHDRYRYK